MKPNLESLSSIEPPLNPKQCVEWALSLANPQTKDEKYKLHLTKTYFRENILSFNREELEILQSQTTIMDSVRGILGDVILTMCVEKNKTFPIIINDWKKSKAPQSRIIQYVRLLVKENNEEQLRFFCNHHIDIVRLAAKGQKNNSDFLTNIIINYFPSDLFYAEWSEEKKCAWINSNPQLVRRLEGYIPNNASSTLRETIYKNLTDTLVNAELTHEETTYQRKLFNRINSQYFDYLKKHSPEFLKTALSRQVPLDRDETSIVNHAQDMLINTYLSGVDEIQKFFNPLKEFLSTEITNSIGLYQKKQSPFEWALENDRYQFFIPYSLNDTLKEEEKEIILAMAFNIIKNKYTYNDLNISMNQMDEYLMWARERACEATMEQFNRYSERVTKGCNESSLRKEIESIGLYISLNNNLETNLNNSTITKKAKV